MLPRPDDPVVDPERACRLIEAACPELAPVTAVPFGRGWDHDVHLVNDAWIFRFPRNEFAAVALPVEWAVLPWLAPRLPCAVPVTRWRGRLDTPEAWPFAGYPLLPGSTWADAGLSSSERASLAGALGAFVRALHAASPADAPMAVPPDPLGRYSEERRERALRRLADFRKKGAIPSQAADRLVRAIESCSGSPPARSPVLVHGDLHLRNVLVEGGALSGVIDWVDLHLGHPATDLAAAFEMLPPRARDVFFQACGESDPELIQWARWRAVDHLAAAVEGHLARGNAAQAEASRAALLEAAEN